ncbi:MAG: hypothetical protein WC679_11245 [Bacteroidales bacterium]
MGRKKNQANNFDNSPERLILFKNRLNINPERFNLFSNRLNINSKRFNLISIINTHYTKILHLAMLIHHLIYGNKKIGAK